MLLPRKYLGTILLGTAAGLVILAMIQHDQRRDELQQEAASALVQAAAAHQVAPGMTADQVRTAWGAPQRVRTTTTAQAVEEWWYYPSNTLLLRDGRVAVVDSHQ